MKYLHIYKSTYSIVLSALATLLFNLPADAQTGKTDSVVFEFTGIAKTWTVPTGVTSLRVDARGAEGGGKQAGKGGSVQCQLPVKAGDKLTIHVGGQATGDAGGYNGGGAGCGKGYGGGGATDICLNGDGLDARIIVAGGGGGIGYGGYGGAGGGLTGGNGAYDTTAYHFAKGGTQTEGGAGARAYYSEAGQKGTGGKGLDSRGNCTNNAMGGGGGGYYGGGGSGAGGGGGGSSYTASQCTKVTHLQGVQEGNGRLVLYWDIASK
jgi:hypothetical protein